MSKETILEEAARVTGGDRNASYGDPNQDFRRTADMWTGLFQDKLKPGERFEPQDVAMAMILVKCSRQIHQKKRDNWTDMAGYAFCGNCCDEADSPQAVCVGDYTDQGGSEPASEGDPGDGRQGDDKIEMRYRELFYKALSSVDRVFQLCTENPTPLLPDFVPAADDKFEAVVTLAEEYIKHTKALEDILRSCGGHAKDIASNRLANSLYRCDSDEIVPDGNSGDLREGDVVYVKPGYKLKNDDYQKYERHLGFVSGKIDKTSALETIGVTVHDNQKGFRVAIRVPCAVLEKNIFNA